MNLNQTDIHSNPIRLPQNIDRTITHLERQNASPNLQPQSNIPTFSLFNKQAPFIQNQHYEQDNTIEYHQSNCNELANKITENHNTLKRLVEMIDNRSTVRQNTGLTFNKNKGRANSRGSRSRESSQRSGRCKNEQMVNFENEQDLLDVREQLQKVIQSINGKIDNKLGVKNIKRVVDLKDIRKQLETKNTRSNNQYSKRDSQNQPYSNYERPDPNIYTVKEVISRQFLPHFEDRANNTVQYLNIRNENPSIDKIHSQPSQNIAFSNNLRSIPKRSIFAQLPNSQSVQQIQFNHFIPRNIQPQPFQLLTRTQLQPQTQPLSKFCSFPHNQIAQIQPKTVIGRIREQIIINRPPPIIQINNVGMGVLQPLSVSRIMPLSIQPSFARIQTNAINYPIALSNQRIRPASLPSHQQIQYHPINQANSNIAKPSQLNKVKSQKQLKEQDMQSQILYSHPLIHPHSAGFKSLMNKSKPKFSFNRYFQQNQANNQKLDSIHQNQEQKIKQTNTKQPIINILTPPKPFNKSQNLIQNPFKSNQSSPPQPRANLQNTYKTINTNQGLQQIAEMSQQNYHNSIVRNIGSIESQMKSSVCASKLDNYNSRQLQHTGSRKLKRKGIQLSNRGYMTQYPRQI